MPVCAFCVHVHVRACMCVPCKATDLAGLRGDFDRRTRGWSRAAPYVRHAGSGAHIRQLCICARADGVVQQSNA